MVLRGFTTIWSLATLPTSSSPFSETATTLGRISAPLSLGTTRAILLRTYATHVFVVPRSIPRRMGFSAISVARRVARCYGGRQGGRKKTPCRREPTTALGSERSHLRGRSEERRVGKE